MKENTQTKIHFIKSVIPSIGLYAITSETIEIMINNPREIKNPFFRWEIWIVSLNFNTQKRNTKIRDDILQPKNLGYKTGSIVVSK